MSDQPPDVNRPPHPPPDPLAESLARLDPAPPALDRDRLMFEAGAASRVPVVRLWQLTAGFLAAAGFAAGMFFRPPTVVFVEKSAVPAPAPFRAAPPAVEPRGPELPDAAPGRTETPALPESAPLAAPEPIAGIFRTAEPGDAARWLQLRNEVLSVGLGVLPDPGRHGATPRPAPGGPVIPPWVFGTPQTPPKQKDPKEQEPDPRDD
jgi:hypothetical protein